MPANSSVSPAAAQQNARRSNRPVPVVSPTGKVYPSVSAAAFDHGMLPATLYPLAKLNRKGWRIAGPADLAATDQR